MTCLQCGATFDGADRQKYCSRNCQHQGAYWRYHDQQHGSQMCDYPVGRQVWFRWMGLFLTCGIVTDLRDNRRKIELKTGLQEWVHVKELTEQRPCTIGGAI